MAQPGTPLAYGVQLSELATEEFKDTILPFDPTPRFHKFPQGGLFNKLVSIKIEFGKG